MEKEIETRRQRMQELNSQAQDLVDAGHFDPNAVEETRIVMEERCIADPLQKTFSCNMIEMIELYIFSVSAYSEKIRVLQTEVKL